MHYFDLFVRRLGLMPKNVFLMKDTHWSTAYCVKCDRAFRSGYSISSQSL